MSARPTLNAHSGIVHNSKSFQQAYDEILHNPNRSYRTKAGTPFTCEARITSRGQHTGERVIVFKQGGVEMARAYACCWGKVTNCNRTYIYSYTPMI